MYKEQVRSWWLPWVILTCFLPSINELDIFPRCMYIVFVLYSCLVWESCLLCFTFPVENITFWNDLFKLGQQTLTVRKLIWYNIQCLTCQQVLHSTLVQVCWYSVGHTCIKQNNSTISYQNTKQIRTDGQTKCLTKH